MSHTAQQLLTEALSLPETDRGELVARLIDSLDSQSDADAATAWSEEIERRLREMDDGAVQMVPWPDALRMIRGTDGPAAN